MHELSISNSILELVAQQARAAGATKVTGINLTFGELCGFSPEAVRMCLEGLGKNTLAEGATLSFNNIRAAARCQQCGRESCPSEHEWLCPHCGQGGLEITHGRELRVDSIEVD
jgi:hydrogenase nickel incorporation protein HypA/HybF